MNTLLFVGTVVALGFVGGGIQGLFTSEGHWWWRYVAVASEGKRSREEAKKAVTKIWVPGAVLLGVLGGATAFVVVFGFFLVDSKVAWETPDLTWGIFAASMIAGLGGSAGSKAIIDNVQWGKLLPAALKKDPQDPNTPAVLVAKNPVQLAKLL